MKLFLILCPLITKKEITTLSTENYYIELLPDEPILIFGTNDGYSLADDQPQVIIEVQQFLDQASEPLYHIIDVSELVLSLDEIILAANYGARGKNEETMSQRSPVWKHPNLQELVFVTDKKLISLAVKGLDSLTFGNIQAKVFASQEEALTYIRNTAAKQY